MIRFCGGCAVYAVSFEFAEDVASVAEEVAAAVEDVAPDEITGAKIRVSRGGSSSLSSAKWMKSALSWPLRLFKTRKVMSFVYLSLSSCCLNRLPRRREAAGPRFADSCCRTYNSAASNRRSRRCSWSFSAMGCLQLL